jgi:hypothetical protein
LREREREREKEKERKEVLYLVFQVEGNGIWC